MKPNDVFKLDMTAARLAGDAEARVAKPTPDKTLEELERILAEFHKHVMECAYDDANPNHICPDTARLNPILLLFQSATAAQQREVERIRRALEIIAGSGCEGEDPEQACKELEANPSSYCLPCKADHALSHSGKEGV